MGQCLHQNENCFQKLRTYATSRHVGIFPLSIWTCLLMKLKVNTQNKPAKQSICYDSKDSRWPVDASRKQNHEK